MDTSPILKKNMQRMEHQANQSDSKTDILGRGIPKYEQLDLNQVPYLPQIAALYPYVHQNNAQYFIINQLPRMYDPINVYG